MKEESWREYVTLNLLQDSDGGTSAKPRYLLSEIIGVTDSYKASPGASGTAGVGQFMFALSKLGSVNMGQCITGDNLTPWGICCYMPCNINSACSNDSCVVCGFSTGSASAVFVALGSVSTCGATLFRRII